MMLKPYSTALFLLILLITETGLNSCVHDVYYVSPDNRDSDYSVKDSLYSIDCYKQYGISSINVVVKYFINTSISLELQSVSLAANNKNLKNTEAKLYQLNVSRDKYYSLTDYSIVKDSSILIMKPNESYFVYGYELIEKDAPNQLHLNFISEVNILGERKKITVDTVLYSRNHYRFAVH